MADIGVINPPEPAPKPALVSVVKQPDAPVKSAAPKTQQPAETPVGQNLPVLPVGSVVKPGFNDPTALLNTLFQIKQAKFEADIDTMKKNSLVAQRAAADQGEIYDSTIAAYDNVMRANRLPGGASGTIAKKFGLFDGDYNVDNQRIKVEENSVRGQQITERAQTQMNINSTLPTLLGSEADIVKANVDVLNEGNRISIEQDKNAIAKQQLAIEKTRALIAIHAENRAQVQFTVDSMGLEDSKAALALAKQGKGPFAGMANGQGLLEAHITGEEKATAELSSAQSTAAVGDINATKLHMKNLAEYMPLDKLAPLVLDAKKKGSGLIEFKNFDGKGNTFNLPVSIAEEAINEGMDRQGKANAAVATEIANTSNLGAKLGTVARGSAAMSSVSPIAASVLQGITEARANLDVKNPGSVQQFAAVVEANNKTLQDEVGKFATTFGTKDAQNAIIEWGRTGTFQPNAGQAVVADSMGLPSLASNSRYRETFTFLNQKLADSLAAQNISSIAYDPSQPEISTQMIMNQVLQKSGGRQKIETLARTLLSDPKQMKTVADQMSQVVTGQGLVETLRALAKGNHASSVWHDLVQNGGQIKIGNTIDQGKLADYLEQRSVETGYKVNYSKIFADSLRAYSTGQDDATTTDPRYTPQDHALEAMIYGSRPHQAILSDFVRSYQKLAETKYREMQDRIKRDLSGMTDAQANTNNTVLGQPGYIGPDMSKGVDFTKVPSATGAKLTAEQVRQLYGGK